MHVGQLTVNLRPVWSPASGAIASLAGRFPDTVWKLVFKELESLQKEERSERPDWFSGRADENGETATETNESTEQERSWRDPSAFKLRGIVKVWISDEKCKKSIIEVRILATRL